MNDAIIGNINALVQPDDVFWCLGDFCFVGGKDYYRESAIYRSRIKCATMHMVWGNHDTSSKIASLFNTSHKMEMIAINPESGRYYIDEEVIRPFGLDEIIKIMQARPGFWMDYHGKRGNRDEE